MNDTLRKLRKRAVEAAKSAPAGAPKRDHSDLFEVAPPTAHTLDPVTTIEDVSKLAGGDTEYFDSMQGIGKMATGEVDALAELEVESATAGTPMDVAHSETIFYSRDEPDQDEDEPFDWCDCL